MKPRKISVKKTLFAAFVFKTAMMPGMRAMSGRRRFYF
jgi:hypothetical protein